MSLTPKYFEASEVFVPFINGKLFLLYNPSWTSTAKFHYREEKSEAD